MLRLPEVRISNFFELRSFFQEKNKIGKVIGISQKQVLIDRKWVDLNLIIPICISEDILLHSGFTEFRWLKGSAVFECNHFKCTLDRNGVNLFCANFKNLKPVKYLHELQNLYFDLTGEELDVNFDYIKSAKTQLV
jgi:hypothetical protein